jgi:hypothetical protein
MAEALEFDPDTLTLGELLAVEEASGLTTSEILGSFGRRSTLRLLVAVFVQRLRSSGEPPSWRSLTDLRILDALSGDSPSPADSPSPRSNDSESEMRPISLRR